MDISEIVIMPVCAEETGIVTDNMVGLAVPESVLGEPGKIPSLRIHRESMGIAGMTYVPVSRHAELEVAAGLESSVGPVVIRLFK